MSRREHDPEVAAFPPLEASVWAVVVTLTCPADLHVLAQLRRQHPEDPREPAGEVRVEPIESGSGAPTGVWADGSGTEIALRRGTSLDIDDDGTTPLKAHFRCMTCRSTATPQRRWAKLVALVDAAQAQSLNKARVAVRD